MPNSIDVSQNYPNLFNPVTTLRFMLNKNSDIRLSFYNSTGELISEEFLNNLSAGEHQYQFNGSSRYQAFIFVDCHPVSFLN
ncbi:MAG: hypothetical protein IPG53_14175 [Ignavibacteriales bacterium]|nr:hypothetical protein [Ignavibacteriales bacterium]